MKIIKRLILLAMVISALMTASALAEKALITGSGARAYAKSDLSGKSAKISKYTVVELSQSTDGVAEIKYRGYTAYIDAAYIQKLGEGTEKQFSQDARVYQYPNSNSRSAAVSAGTKVNVLTVSNGCAVVEKSGNIAFAYEKYLEEVPVVHYDEFQAIVTAETLKVRASANENADVVAKYSKNDIITVTAYTDIWARVNISGGEGYCSISALTKYVKPNPTAGEIFADSTTTNEQKIYKYLVYCAELGPAAACGVLANIECESGFRPTAYNSSGGSYGICQWTGGRYTALKEYCSQNGYGYDTLEGQCRYLSYELKNKYSSVLTYMKGVDSSAQGAYDAGYYWCYNFEVPANRASVSVKRGGIARDEYWPKYD